MLLRPCRVLFLRTAIVDQRVLPRKIRRAPFLPNSSFSVPGTLRHISDFVIERVAITANRKEAQLFSSEGAARTQSISPTPKARLDRLETGLTKLLSGRREASTQFGSATWQLDPPEGASITRHFAFRCQQDRDRAAQLIQAVSDELNHHPHVARGATPEHPFCMTITCTTHQPRGLSVRDARLATKIDKCLADLEMHGLLETTATSREQDMMKDDILKERHRLLALNMAAIAQALDSCACDTKSVSTTHDASVKSEGVGSSNPP